MNRHWKKEELATLRRLRERFIARTAGKQDYWQKDEELALYDATFGERIGWKWDAVLRELTALGWKPRSRKVLDWGCGSGVAGRRVLAQWPHLETLALHDRSARAVRFAAERAPVPMGDRVVDGETLLVLSHVLSELPATELAALLALARKAGEVLWVEAGTHADSRRLIAEVREVLLPEFTAIAPCTHQAACGLLTERNAPHWCHHFATVPAEIFQDGRWMEFGREMSIDLRALPYSYLVLARGSAPLPAGCSRVIGRPREAKGFAKILSCHAEGVGELVLQKRDAPELFRAFHKEAAGAVYRWDLEDGRILKGERML